MLSLTSEPFGTPQELILIPHLRALIPHQLAAYPYINTTWNLLRFLRARDHDLKKTQKMIKAYLRFRNEINYEEIMKMEISEFDKIRQNWAIGFCGHDYTGRVITIDRIEMDNAKEILKTESKEKIEKYIIQRYERIINICFPIMSEIFKRRVDKLFVIIDLQNFNLPRIMKNKLVQFLKIVSVIGQDIYPELLDKCFIIKAPLLFKGLWAIGKTMMDQKTIQKFDIEDENWQEKLSKFLDLDKLPVFLGGKNAQPFDDTNGPWHDEMLKSYKNKTFFLEEDTLYQKYFLEPNEKFYRPSKNMKPNFDEVNPTQALVSMNGGSIRFPRDKNYIQKVRVESYRSHIV